MKVNKLCEFLKKTPELRIRLEVDITNSSLYNCAITFAAMGHSV